MPGLGLFEFISKQNKIYDVYFLQNHGLIVNSDNISELENLHSLVHTRIKQNNISLKEKNKNEFGYLTPDEYIYRDCKELWYTDMKNYYDFIRDNYECNFIDKNFLYKLEILEFEKHRKSL
jgi:hypothetical protein